MSDQSPTVPARMIIGAGIMALGVLMLLDALEVFDTDRVIRAWPVILIVIGLLMLQRGARTGRWVGGAVLTLIGGIFLAQELGWLTVGIDRLWPLFIIFAGLGILLRGSRSRGRYGRKSSPHAVGGDHVSEFAILCGLTPRVTSDSFQGGDVSAFMGGCELDLRGADIEGDVDLRVFALMGGIEIIVPPDWSVDPRVTPFMGGVEDKTRPLDEPSGKRLTLSGFVMMGGVEIHN